MEADLRDKWKRVIMSGNVGFNINSSALMLNKRFGESNVDLDDEIIDIGESEWFTTISKKIKLGTIIRTYRENCLLTQQQLADKVGISKASHISDIENGRRQISKTLVKKFAEVFGITPEMLL